MLISISTLSVSSSLLATPTISAEELDTAIVTDSPPLCLVVFVDESEGVNGLCNVINYFKKRTK